MKEIRTEDIIRYENDEMTAAEEVVFFQTLIDTDMAWKLQGCYGRRAKALIEAGVCHPKKEDDGGEHAV